MRDETAESRRRLYLQVRVLVARHYKLELSLRGLAAALASSPRQIQRAYAQSGAMSFREDLRARRLRAGAQLLAEQPSIRVEDVARLVGYNQPSHFARAFRDRYGRSPRAFRALARAAHTPVVPTAVSSRDARAGSRR